MCCWLEGRHASGSALPQSASWDIVTAHGVQEGWVPRILTCCLSHWYSPLVMDPLWVFFMISLLLEGSERHLKGRVAVTRAKYQASSFVAAHVGLRTMWQRRSLLASSCMHLALLGLHWGRRFLCPSFVTSLVLEPL